MLKLFVHKFLSPYVQEVLKDELKFHVKQILLREYLVHGDPTRVHIASSAIVNNALSNVTSGRIYVEENAFFGHNISLLTGTHDVTKLGKERQTSVPRSGRDIVIRRGAWIASNTTIIGPCEIGENAVVGACSLVIGDVQPNHFYAGTPAKMVKKINIVEGSSYATDSRNS